MYTTQLNTPCFICEENLWHPKLSGTVNGSRYTIYQCIDCGFAKIYPQPKKVYEKYEINFYVNHLDLFNHYMAEILSFVKKYKQKGTLLDIGAHIGLLVKQAKDVGFSAEGIELSKEAIDYGEKQFGIIYNKEKLELLSAKSKKYDVITMNHVLEHVDNLDETLHNVYQLLKEKGILVVALPNFSSLSARVLRTHWPSLQPSEHLWFFNSSTLGKLLEKHGFIIREKVVNEPYREYNGIKGFLRWILYAPWYYICDKLNSGRNLIVVAEKPTK